VPRHVRGLSEIQARVGTDCPAGAPPGDPRLRLPPASSRCCDSRETAVSHPHPGQQRLVAHYMATSYSAQRSTGGPCLAR